MHTCVYRPTKLRLAIAISKLGGIVSTDISLRYLSARVAKFWMLYCVGLRLTYVTALLNTGDSLVYFNSGVLRKPETRFGRRTWRQYVQEMR